MPCCGSGQGHSIPVGLFSLSSKNSICLLAYLVPAATNNETTTPDWPLPQPLQQQQQQQDHQQPQQQSDSDAQHLVQEAARQRHQHPLPLHRTNSRRRPSSSSSSGGGGGFATRPAPPPTRPPPHPLLSNAAPYDDAVVAYLARHRYDARGNIIDVGGGGYDGVDDNNGHGK